MRDDQYYALANLVRKPMRRWWAKVGSWWLVGLGLLLVAQVAQLVYEFQMQQAGIPQSIWYHNLPSWYENADGLKRIIPAVSIGAALLAAFSVITKIDLIALETPIFSDPLLRVHKYKLALLNSWPALTCIFLMEMMDAYQLRMFSEIPGFAWLTINFSLQASLKQYIWVAWLIAVGVAANRIQWPVWSLFFGGLVAPNLITIIYFSPWPNLDLFPKYQEHSFSDWEKIALYVIGILLIYGLVWFYLICKKWMTNLLVIGFSVLMLLNGIGAGFGIRIIDQVIFAGNYLPKGMQPLVVWYVTAFYEFNQPTLDLDIGHFSWEFPANPAWAIVPVLNGIFWLFAHYFAFSWLMGKKLRNSKTPG